jgi:glycerate kinase
VQLPLADGGEGTVDALGAQRDGATVVEAAQAIPLDPEHTDSVEGWRDEKWGVDWPFPASELEETVRR